MASNYGQSGEVVVQVGYKTKFESTKVQNSLQDEKNALIATRYNNIM